MTPSWFSAAIGVIYSIIIKCLCLSVGGPEYKYPSVNQHKCWNLLLCFQFIPPKLLFADPIVILGYTLAANTHMLFISWKRSRSVMTSSNRNIFRITALCAGKSPVTGEFPVRSPVARSFDVFFDLRLNKRLSKQSQGRWFETQSRSLWRHCNAIEKNVGICPQCTRKLFCLTVKANISHVLNSSTVFHQQSTPFSRIYIHRSLLGYVSCLF